MSPFLVLILFYLLNHDPTESKWAFKRDAFENINKQKTYIGNGGRSNNDKKKEFINLMNSDDTTSVEVEVTEKMQFRHSKTKIHDDDQIISQSHHDHDHKFDESMEDIDSEESFEMFNSQNDKRKKTDESQDYKIDKKNIIKTSNFREVYEITVNNINKTILYIYDKDKRNRGMKAVTSRRDIDQPRLQNFLIRVFNSSLKSFNILHENIKDPILKIIVHSGIEYYRKEYKDHMKEMKKANNNHLDQVISVLESINLGQHLMDSLFAVIVIRSNNTNSAFRIENVVRKHFDKLFEAQNEFICKELGVCRSATTFKNSYIEMIDIILKGDDNKLFAAMSTFLKVFGQSTPRFYQMYQTLMSLQGGEELANQYARQFLTDLKQNIKDGKNPAIEKVPATPENIALWKKITAEVQAFMNDEIKDLTPTVTALMNFVKPYMKQIHNRKKPGNAFANISF